MRLICPKCDAQYNVADDAIPKGGRDVQCSTCGHTWFQTEMSRVLSRPVSRVLSRPIPTAVKSESRDPKTAPSRDVGAYDVPHQHNAAGQHPLHQPKHRPVDASIANILREEAAREHKVSTPEKDKGTNTTPKAPKEPEASADLDETRQRIAKMTGEEGGTRSGEQPPGTNATNPRAVPSMGEINAVLRTREHNNSNDELTEAERLEAIRRQGFRRGFFLVTALFVVIVTPYVMADQIIKNLPQSSETMTQYVAVIDELRASMNVTITGIVDSLRALTGQG